MKARWIVPLTVLGTVVAVVAMTLAVLALGAVNIGADVEPGWIESALASWSRERAVERRAPKMQNPYAGDSAAIAAGMEHYRENCLVCHSAPGVPISEISKGLNPPAPVLRFDKGEISDGELFWVTKHGIRFTSMPSFAATHTDEQIWKIVAFLRHLPKLTAEETAYLQQAQEGKEPHEERSAEHFLMRQP
jgi:mono/diheme cytochrome c family protein